MQTATTVATKSFDLLPDVLITPIFLLVTPQYVDVYHSRRPPASSFRRRGRAVCRRWNAIIQSHPDLRVWGKWVVNELGDWEKEVERVPLTPCTIHLDLHLQSFTRHRETIPNQLIANLLDDRVVIRSFKCVTNQNDLAAFRHLGRSLLGMKEGVDRNFRPIELTVDGKKTHQILPALIDSLQPFAYIQRLTLSRLRFRRQSGLTPTVTFPVLRVLLFDHIMAASVRLVASINAPLLHTFAVRCIEKGLGDGPGFALVYAFPSVQAVVLHGAEHLYDTKGFHLEVKKVFPNASTIQATFGSLNEAMLRAITTPSHLQTLQVKGPPVVLIDLAQVLQSRTPRLRNFVG